MSRSHEEGESDEAAHREALDGLNRMIDQGRSFSGHERNVCFLNTGGPRFATASAVSGIDFPDDARAIAPVDWDQDGDLDLWVSNRNAPRLRLLRNDTPPGHHSLALRLRGNGTTTNRDAVGARVEVIAAGLKGKRLLRSLRAGEGMLSQGSKWVHVGLGTLDRIDQVVVSWPGGGREAFTGVRPDGRFLLVQGEGAARPWEKARPDRVLKPSEQKPLAPADAMRVPLHTLLPLPRQVEYVGFGGGPRRLPLREGKPLLVSLWASWCTPCRAELREFTDRQDEIRSAGIEVVALSVDGLGEDGSTPEAAAALLDRMQFPFPAGSAREDFVQLMQGYHHLQVVLVRPLPIPTTLLIDGKGRLSVVYKGKVSLDAVLADARALPDTLAECRARAACFPGRSLDHPRVARDLERFETRKRFLLANAFRDAGRLEDAREQYVTVLEREPGFGTAHGNLADVLRRLGQAGEAVPHYLAALKEHPKDARLLYNLGVVLEKQGRPDAAADRYRQALEARPDYMQAHVNLGGILARQKKYPEAAGHFRRALEIDPDFAPARQNLRIVEAAMRGG